MLKWNLRVLVTALLAAEVAVIAAFVAQPVEQERSFEECPDPLPVRTYSVHCDRTPPVGFDEMVEDAAAEFGVDPKVLATTVYRESDCNPKALGSSGDVGLTQVVPKVWAKTLKQEGIIVDTSDLWDPLTNLRASAYILSRLSADAGGDLWGTFRRYNGAGPRAKKYATEQVQAYTARWGSSV